MSRPWSRREWVCFGWAAAAYLVVALFVLRNVLPEPARLLPYNSDIDAANQTMGHFDQSMVVSVIVRNADILVTEPWKLLGDGQCFPFPKSYTLGEHMFGEGLLMAIPWMLTGDPILAYNLMLVLTLWIPGVTMYLFAHHFLRRAAPAFVAGLLLAMSPPRIIDGGHPYLHAEFWLPLILLFLHQVFASRWLWLPAAGIALLLALEALETIYVLLACAIVTSVYGLFLAARFRSALPRVVLPLAAAVVLSVGFAWFVLGPYFETREAWSVLRGRPTALFPIETYGWGSPFFVGAFGLVLGVVGLVDRLIRRRDVHRDDPRVAMLAAAVAIVWASVVEIPIPGTGLGIPGLFALLAEVVPGLDAVRGLFAVTIGLWVPVALLAGYGALVLLERLPRRLAAGVAAALALGIVGERSVPAFAEWSFGTPLELLAWDARPPEDDIELVRAVDLGPVFDVPVAPPENSLARAAQARHLLLQAWNPKPSSSCYNSFDTPLASQMAQLASGLPSRGVAEAIAALGFGEVLSHDRAWWPPHLKSWRRRAADPNVSGVMPEVGRSSGLTAYRLVPPEVLHEDLHRLDGAGRGPAVELVRGDEPSSRLVVPFVFSNPGPGTFRGPAPLRPRAAKLRWRSADGSIPVEEDVRVLWPAALGAGKSMKVEVSAARPPAPGTYRVELSSADAPDVVVASRAVRVPEA